MALFSPCISNSEASGARVIRGSLRAYEDADYMHRTPSVEGDRRTWTWSGWVQREQQDDKQAFLHVSTNSNNETSFGFYHAGATPNAGLYFRHEVGGSVKNVDVVNSMRDFSGFYHLVFVLDTTESSQGDRIKMYMNGEQLTIDTATNLSQNDQLDVNKTISHELFDNGRSIAVWCSEVHFVDGQALDASYFGFTDQLTGIWRPKTYVNTTASPGDKAGVVGYGTCGYYLPFDGTGTSIGQDQSGQGNDWTGSSLDSSDIFYNSPSGISQSADPNSGITTTGFPTLYSTLNFNAAEMDDCSNRDEGGLRARIGNQGNGDERPIGNMSFTSGKYYWEWEFISTTDSAPWAGLANPGVGWDSNGAMNNRWTIRTSDNERTQMINGSQVEQTALGSGNSTGWYGIAVDADTGEFWCSYEGTWQASGNPETGANPIYDTLKSAGTGELIPYWGTDGGSTTIEMRVNFGQSPFKFQPPEGYKPLCSANLPRPVQARTDKNYFKPVLYSGSGSTRAVDTGFQPDLVWVKRRDATNYHIITDTVRGAGNYLVSNTEDAESSGGSQLTNGFFWNGFQVGNENAVNNSSGTYVAWCWKAGGSSGTFNIDGVVHASASAAGLDGGGITPTAASINTQCGFSIIAYTGTGSNSSFSHGLGTKPYFMIIKSRDAGEDWCVYHPAIQSGSSWFSEGNYYLLLNKTNHAAYATTTWANTYPTDTLVKIGTSGLVNTDDDKYIAYIWTNIPGVQKFGEYRGSGQNNNFIYCGFRPAFIMCKRYEANSSPDTSTSYTSWSMYDTSRNTYAEQTPNQLWANGDEGEGVRGNLSATSGLVDMMIEAHATGFYMHDYGSEVNAATGQYIYAAWAETGPNMYGATGNPR